MSSGPRTAVGAGIYGAGAGSKVGYPNGSDGVVPPSHAGTFSRARSDCCLSLLNSLHTRWSMPMTDRLERRRCLFLDSASTLFFGGVKSGSGELPEDIRCSVAIFRSDRLLAFILFNWGCRVATPSCIFDSFAFQTSQ